MKLGQLKAAIRSTKGNPFIRTRLSPGGPEIKFVLQKAPLLEELEAAFPGGKAVETGLRFDERAGELSSEGLIQSVIAPIGLAQPRAEVESLPLPFDDLLV